MHRLLLLPFVMLFSLQAVAQVNLSAGLVAYYPFNGTFADASGNGNNGVAINGITFGTDQWGNANSAASFDGIDDWINVPSPSFTFGHTFSLSFRFKTNSAIHQVLMAKSDYTTAQNFNFQVAFNHPTLGAGLYLGTNHNGTCTTGATGNFNDYGTVQNLTAANQWYCVVMTFNNGVKKIFVNGTLASQHTVTTGTNVTTADSCVGSPFRMGTWWQNDTRYFNGLMDEIRLYNRTLNQQEIDSFCNLVTPPSPCNCTNTPVNLLQNGDFENLNTTANPPNYIGFQTDYPNNTNGGQYGWFKWTNDASQFVGGWCATTGTNHYLAFDGAATSSSAVVSPYDAIRYVNIPVVPGQTYRISYDAMNILNVPGYPYPALEVKVNGVSLGISTINNTCLPFQTHTYCWTANTTTATFVITAGIGAGGGRDFAIDNVYFGGCSVGTILQPVIINKYAAVTARLPCDNTFTVDTAIGFNAGDTVLMIQMKGATIDSSNTAAFGNVTALNGAGNYEYNVIKAVSGNNITLVFKVKRQYNIPNGLVQFVRVANFQNYTVAQKHTCLPWTGTKGGVFIINVAGSLTLNDHIDVTGKGFRGGQPLLVSQYGCNRTDYFYPSTNNEGAEKGEGITSISSAKQYGRGKLANGGGGGNDHNASGGGGGNGGIGGLGGNQFLIGSCAATPNIGGVGGDSLSYSISLNRIYLGGGGGAGHGNNFGEKPGGMGGGIAIVIANNIIPNGNFILANGNDAIECNGPSPGCQDDGVGGGGGGGTVITSINSYTSNLTTNAKGGKGANGFINLSLSTTPISPGGGGGGGIIWFKQGTIPGSTTNSIIGGVNGVAPQFSNTNAGAQPGTNGKVLTSMPYTYPMMVDTFRPNVIAVGFTDSVASCFTRKFINITTTTGVGAASYSWNAGVAGTSTLQSPAFIFPGYGTYPVKLIVVDSNGCRDSLTKNIIIPYTRFANAGADTTTCLGLATMLHASGGLNYLWTQDGTVATPNSPNTVVTPMVTTAYIVTVTDAFGCVDSDTALVTLVPGGQVVASPHMLTNCLGKTVQLNATGVTNYQWSPAVGLSNPAIPNPLATVQAGSITYLVTGKDNRGCVSFDSVVVTETPGPVVDAYADGDGVSCYSRAIQLHANGALSYHWQPGAYLNDSTIASPVATPPHTTVFTVVGTDALGCSGRDTITIISYGQSAVYIPNAFTPNGDHINDDIRPVIFCDFILDKWEVFNRWGQSVYQGYNLNKGWDGSFKEQPAPTDVYIYYARGKNDKGETVIYKGNITLMR